MSVIKKGKPYQINYKLALDKNVQIPREIDLNNEEIKKFYLLTLQHGEQKTIKCFAATQSMKPVKK